MTTGNVVRNNLVAVNTDAGPGGVGTYFRRSWNGADYPTTLPFDRGIVRPPRTLDQSLVDYIRSKSYRVKPPRRQTTEHAYVTDGRRLTDNICTIFVPFVGNTSCTVRNWTGGLLYPGSNTWSSNDTIALLGKLRENVFGSDFDLGVFLGEGHEALKMITTAATRIYTAYSNIRKGNFFSAFRALVPESRSFRPSTAKTVAGAWLELQYGWLPLVKDAAAGAEFLAHRFSYPFSKVYRAKHSLPYQSLDTGASTIYGFDRSSYRQTRYVKAIISEQSSPSLVSMIDPATIAWELTPFSFVADWFIPIGSYLQARGLAQLLSGTFVTSTLEKGYGKGPVIPKPSSGAGFLHGSESFYEEFWSFGRSISYSLDVPLPTVKPLSKVASWKHCLNAVALLVQHHGS